MEREELLKRAQLLQQAKLIQTSKVPQETSTPEEETSKLESLARGAEQGALFGFGDELNASLESLISGKPYEQARTESRAAFDKAQTDNPLTSMAGNLAGGFAVPLPGAGEASIARMAALGAGGGALAGLGNSTADLTSGDLNQVKTAGKDMMTSGLVGGGLGAGLGAIGKGVGKGVAAWKDTDSSKNLGKMFDYARKDPQFNTAATLEKTSKELSGAIKDEYLPQIFNLGEGPSIQSAVTQQYQAAKQAATDQGRKLDFTTFRDKIIQELDAVQIKDPNYVKGRKEIEGLLDALGQVERREVSVASPDAQQADQAMEALKSTVGKAVVTSDEAIRKVAKGYAEKIAEGNKVTNPGEIRDLENEIFDRLKSKYTETFNPKFGVDIDPATGKKFATAEYESPTGTMKMKAKEFQDNPSTETIETIGRPELTPDVLDAASRKGQELFDTYNMGNDSTRRNSDLAQIGLNMKSMAAPEAKDPVLGNIADFMRSKFGDIKASLGLDFRGLGGDELKQAQLDAADKIKTMLMASAKKIGTNGEMRFDDATAVAQDLKNAGYIDGIDIAPVAQKLKDLAEKEYLMRTAQGESLLSSNTQRHLLMPFSAKAKGLQLASMTGKVVGAADEAGVTKLAGNTMRYITADSETIANLATKLEQSNSTFAPVLRNMANQPDQKRRALMFSLMQQPAFRQAIKSDEGE